MDRYLLTKLTPRKYIVVKDNGHYNVFFGVETDPDLAHFGEVVCGPCDYSAASAFFTEHTKKQPEATK